MSSGIAHVEKMANIALQIERCESKSAFKTRGEAIIFNGKHHYNNRPYRCPICDMWHLTKQR